MLDPEGTIFAFGEYPQALKENDVEITTTVDSRGYYLGSDGAYYAKVTATPAGTGYKFDWDGTGPQWSKVLFTILRFYLYPGG